MGKKDRHFVWVVLECFGIGGVTVGGVTVGGVTVWVSRFTWKEKTKHANQSTTLIAKVDGCINNQKTINPCSYDRGKEIRSLVSTSGLSRGKLCL
jgi:hypothetical protein